MADTKQSIYEREFPGQALTLDQFTEIAKEVAKNHMFYFWESPLQEKGKHIKYIYHSSLDVRDGTITVFHIAFRGMSGLKKFDYRDSSEPMFDRIMKWLKDLDQRCE